MLVADGFASSEAEVIERALIAQQVKPVYVAGRLGSVAGETRSVLTEKTFATTGSVLFDGVYVPGGVANVQALRDGAAALQFLREACSHYKPLAATGGHDGRGLLGFVPTTAAGGSDHAHDYERQPAPAGRAVLT